MLPKLKVLRYSFRAIVPLVSSIALAEALTQVERTSLVERRLARHGVVSDAYVERYVGSRYRVGTDV